MANLGILAEELDHVSIYDIRARIMARERRQDVPNEVIELRYNAAEKKREDRLAMIIKVSALKSDAIFSAVKPMLNFFHL